MALASKTSKETVKTAWRKMVGTRYLIEVRELLDEKTEEKLYHPVVFKDGRLAFSSGLLKDKEAAITWAVVNYHEDSGDLKELLREGGTTEIDIDIELVREHPKNKEVYGEENYSDLIKFMDVNEPEVSRIEINVQGLVVKGNRRTHVARLLNQKYDRLKFPRLPVRVRHYVNEDDEMKALLLDNAGQRQKTVEQKLKEWDLYKIIEERRARQRMSAGASSRWASEDDPTVIEFNKDEDKGVRSADKSARQAGFGSSGSARTAKKVNTFADSVQATHPQLATGLKQITNKSINAGHEIVRLAEQEGNDVAQQVIARIQAVPTAGAKKVNVKAAIADVKRENAIQQIGEKTLETQEERIKIYEGYSDQPSDNYMTPEDILKMVQDVFGEEGITTDMFADLTKRVPAKNHITIRENALDPKTKVEGNVWANILYSKQGACFEAIDREIRKNHINRVLVLAESGVLNNQRTQPIIADHKFIAMTYLGRIDFIPGEYLEYRKKKEKEARLREVKELTGNEDAVLTEEPEVETREAKNSRINSVFLFYDSVGDRIDQFIKIFGARGQIWYPQPISSTISSQIFNLPWENNEQIFMGHKLSVHELSNELWESRIDDQFIDDCSPDSRFAKATAIARCILETSSSKSLYL
ncbi:MAG: hypothetical protein KME46_25875 [Brasilonema angustatum HA4187-MV1]|jgi:hypothetical protein|nr:hypothetical protein [Brasilonema angustatum HA4187-MV1]